MKEIILVLALATAAQAGTRTINGEEVQTATSKYPTLAAVAGTVRAGSVQKQIDAGTMPGIPKDLYVEGPSAFSGDARRPPPAFVGRLLHKLTIWWKWQRASDPKDRWRFSGPPRHLPHPLLTSAEILALLEKTGADGRALLLPGDILISGIGGVATHVSLYVGKDKAGVPTIVHAMATPKTQQSYPMLVVNVFESLLISKGKVGVFEESLGGFFERFQRDTYFVLRDPKLTDEMRARGIAKARELIGAGYDYDVNQSNDSLYCTELMIHHLRGAYAGTKLALPWVGTTAVHRLALEDFPVTMDNFLASPDFELTVANELGWAHVKNVVRTYVSGAHRE